MNAFIVELEHKPGSFAKMAEAIAASGINITSVSGTTCGTKGSVAMLTNDEPGTRRALAAAHYTYRDIEVVPSTLEDKPGTLAAATRKLADAGVNIEAILPTGMSGNRVTVGFATDNPSRARTALEELVGAVR